MYDSIHAILVQYLYTIHTRTLILWAKWIDKEEISFMYIETMRLMVIMITTWWYSNEWLWHENEFFFFCILNSRLYAALFHCHFSQNVYNLYTFPLRLLSYRWYVCVTYTETQNLEKRMESDEKLTEYSTT